MQRQKRATSEMSLGVIDDAPVSLSWTELDRKERSSLEVDVCADCCKCYFVDVCVL